MRVVKNYEARCAIEIARSIDFNEVYLLGLESEQGFTGITLQTLPLTWSEKLPGGDSVERNFDRYWLPVERGIGESYPVVDAARRFITPALGPAQKFTDEALNAVIEILPKGDINLFSRELGFLGHFSIREDAIGIAKILRTPPLLVETVKDLKAMPQTDLDAILKEIDPEREWPAKLTNKLLNEVITMTKKAKKKQAAKAATPAGKPAVAKKVGVARADGPVAKAREIFAKLHKEGKITDTAAVKAACAKLNINPGTVSVQLGKYRKENKIEVARAAPKPKAKKTDAKPAAAPDKKAAKKKAKPNLPATPPTDISPPKGTGKKKVVKAAKPTTVKPPSTESTKTTAASSKPAPSAPTASEAQPAATTQTELADTQPDAGTES